MFRQIRDIAMTVDARDDAGDHAADYDTGVVQTLIHAQLDILGAEEHGVATHHGYCCFCAHARAGGAFGEG